MAERSPTVWAEGNAVGAGRTDGTDVGAAALIKAGFAPEDARSLSRAFGAERRGMYSPEAAEALRALYERSTRGRVAADAALARAFGGRVRKAGGGTFIDIPLPDGGTGTLAVETTDMSQKFYGETGSDPEMARQVEAATRGKANEVKAADWIRMSDAERREVVENPQNRLVYEGDFELVSPDDPTLSVSASGAANLVGRVTIDPTADPGAGFHEVMHGWLRFCQETGFFDEADVKWLQETYGKPGNAKEQLDEESAADGFRRYCAARAAGAAAEEAGPWRKIYALARRMMHKAERDTATGRLAANAEQALYDQILGGRYAHIRELKFAEPKEAPKAEAGGETAAPQTGAKPKEPAKETKATEATTETSAATVAPVAPVPPAPSGNRVVRWEAQTPKGNKYVGGYYKVFRLADLVHSNDPRYQAHAALQGRNRKDNKREEEERGNIKAEFNGKRYLDNAVTSDGAPLVSMLPDADGVLRPFVLSGNGRVLVLNELVASHLYDHYRNPLKEWAEKNGVEMDVADADNPVLVRVLDDLKGSDLLEISRLSNVRTSTPPTETELARTDAEHLRSLDLAKLYRPNADGSPDMRPGVNDEFFRSFAQGPDGETIFDENNNVGEDAQHRIMRAFLHLAVGDSPRGLAAAQKLITMSGTYGIDRQKGALQSMAPGVARTEGNPDYAIGPDVARAIADFMDFTEMRRAGKIGKLDDYIAQGDMFDQPSEIAADILRTLTEGRGTARDMAERVNAYAEIAAHSDADGALGGAANARSRADVWREAKGLAEQRIAERTPKTRFSIRSEADGKKDEEKKENVVARVQPSEQGQNRPAHLRNDTTQHTLTLESAAPVREFGNSISQAGVKSPADFLTGLVHALGSTETNPDKTQYFDITHEDGKNLSLRVANHRATARQYTDHGNMADVKTSIVVKMSDKPFLDSDGVELTEHVYFSDRLTAEREAGIARAVAEWIGTGEWNGPAADQVNMSPRRRYSIGGIYTGTAADYANRSRKGGKEDGPSLLKIGTGEGAQVYGWGLYGSTVRGVAEGYAGRRKQSQDLMYKGQDIAPVFKFPRNATPEELALKFARMSSSVDGLLSNLEYEGRKDKSYKPQYDAAVEWVKNHRGDFSERPRGNNLYEQTFFTDRAPGDESHLLKWYEPVSGWQKELVENVLSENGVTVRRVMTGPEYDRGTYYEKDGKLLVMMLDQNTKLTGELAYQLLAKEEVLGSPKAASEWLAAHDIDGVKYPVDSYGGKGVKDGDKAGWNYVSFRDDNIRVDHKWTDGQMRYSLKAGTASDYSWVTLTSKPDMKLAQIDPEKFKNYETDSERVSDAHRSIIAAGGEKIGDNYYIRMDGERVLVGGDGLKHRGRKPNLANDFVFPVLGEVLKNAVRVNELEPRANVEHDKNITDTFVYLGALSYGQEVLPVRIQVEHRGNEHRIDRIDVLRSLNTKIGSVAALGGLAPALQTEPTISISNLIRIAQPLHPDIFSRDVAANLNVPYSGTKIDARYSIAGQQGAENMGIKGAAEAEAMEKAGADREEIWRKTGWWRGRDGKWRVEIPDFERVKPAKLRMIEGGFGAPLEELVDAPDLFKAYPDLAKVSVVASTTMNAAGQASVRDGKPIIELSGESFEDGGNGKNRLSQLGASTIMHEVQHVIQHKEGFARGGDEKSAIGFYYSKTNKQLNDLAQRMREARDKSDNGLLGELKAQYDELMQEKMDMSPERAYLALAGEAEARNVQRRLTWSAKLKSTIPPWKTEDVPGDRQIVRYSITSTLETGIASTAEYDDSRGNHRVLHAVIGDARHGRTKIAQKHCVDFGTATTGGFSLDEIRRYENDILTHGVKRFDKKTGRRTFTWKSPEGVTFTVGTFIVGKGRGEREVINTVHTDRNAKETRRLAKEISAAKDQLQGQNPSHQGSAVPAGTTEALKSSSEPTPHNIPKPSDEIKADPEGFARRSLVARVENGAKEEKESALVAFVAERALRNGPKPDAVRTLARIGLELGLPAVDAKQIIRKGEALAERVRGTVIERAAQEGAVGTAAALLAREADIDRLVAGAAGAGGRLVKAGEGKIKNLLDREIEKTVRSFNAATLADVERDTGIDIAGEILANSPEKFDPSASAKATADKRGAETEGGEEGSAPGDSSTGEGNLSDYEIARRQRVRKDAEERVAKMIATAKERSEAAKREREEWEAKREERKRRAEEAAASGEDGGGEGGGEGAAPGDRPKLSTFADFKTPEEFAAFFRVWAEDRYKKEHGASTLGKHEEKRLFPEFYRKAVVRELQDLADKLLPPKGARATVNRWLGEIQPGVRPDTLERISADVFAYINRNAIRESRTEMVRKFRKELKPFAAGAKFEELKMDSDRKVSGWAEEAARYIRRVCELSDREINGRPSQLAEERARLQEILDRREKVYDDEGRDAADAPKSDMETRRALAKLQLLEKYGAMKRLMPGEIADLAEEAVRWLNDEAGKLEEAWRGAREAEEGIRAALVGGIVGPGGGKYARAKGFWGAADRLFDSMNGMIRLRLQHLVRFADGAGQQKAKDAINRVVVMLGDGETAFARHLQDDRAAFHDALARIFARPEGGGVDRRALADWLNRMTEEIPKELSRRLSKQGYGESMTYGQMLQLLVSLEQRSYAEAIEANGRAGQAELIRTFEAAGPDGVRERVLTDRDLLFIDWLRSFYEAKRGMLSEVTKRMTGLPIDSPDPNYCPVKMYTGDKARGMHVDSSAAWDPIGAVFTRRIRNRRDFDESASILGQFFDRSAEAAKLVAWGERGSIIRGVFTDASVQESVRRAFGGGELSKILKQLEETFNGGEGVRKAPGEIAAMDKAMNWMTYLSLGYNPLSAAKQTTSFTVWANALPGGFKDLWRYMTDVDMETIRHIRESDEYKVRYGNEVGSGHDVATKGVFENPSENPLAAFFRKTSMGLLRKGDFLPGGWIAQGLFRDLYNRHLKEGMDAAAADRLAMTETFNMLEETQQSGRTYNTQELVREHGRLGRLLVQFATSPLQQLQWETQTAREVMDLRRYRPAAPDADFEKRYSEAKGRFIRAAVINHVLLPAALHAVTDIYRLAMGQEPEWEKEGWHWSMLRDVVMGQASRITFLGTLGTTLWDAAVTGKVSFSQTDILPVEGLIRSAGQVGKTGRDLVVETWRGMTARDFAESFDYEKVQKDLDRLLRSSSVTRTPYDVVRRVTGNSDADVKKGR